MRETLCVTSQGVTSVSGSVQSDNITVSSSAKEQEVLDMSQGSTPYNPQREGVTLRGALLLAPMVLHFVSSQVSKQFRKVIRKYKDLK